MTENSAKPSEPSQPASAPDATAEAIEVDDSKATTRRLPKNPTRHALRAGIALVSFTAGAVVAPYIEELVSRATPGFFGPDNQQIIADQQANFSRLDAKLAELGLVSDDPKVVTLINEIDQLIAEQKALAERKDERFREVDVERQMLSEQLREDRGATQAVDFWIRPGESVALQDPTIVFSFRPVIETSNLIDAVVSGERKRMDVGDAFSVATSVGPRVILYRHGKRESDGRHGFDVKASQSAATTSP
ncbi:MAG: hypothetical protein AAGI54_01395 [Planctomycetota bacterium]